MTTETNNPTNDPSAAAADGLEMPAPTFWPIVLAASITMLGMGLVTNLLFSIVGAVIFVIALGNWLAHLLPGQGHQHEELVPPEQRPRPIEPQPGAVEQLRPGMAGHRMRIPEKVHPYSAGVKGGIAGGLAMMLPAMIYGLVFHSIWYPINLLAGMVVNLPRQADGTLDIGQMEEFKIGWLLLATLIHATTSVSLGLIYGVLLPMLPGRPYLWGGIVAPVLWTGGIYSFMGVLNPALQAAVDWPSFILSQFIFGLVAGLVVVRSEMVYAEPGRRVSSTEGSP